jgi:hypothetical protein
VFGTEELLWGEAAGASKNRWACGVNEVGCVVMRSGPRGRSGRDDIRKLLKNGKNVWRNGGKRGNNRRRW